MFKKGEETAFQLSVKNISFVRDIDKKLKKNKVSIVNNYYILQASLNNFLSNITLSNNSVGVLSVSTILEYAIQSDIKHDGTLDDFPLKPLLFSPTENIYVNSANSFEDGFHCGFVDYKYKSLYLSSE